MNKYRGLPGIDISSKLNTQSFKTQIYVHFKTDNNSQDISHDIPVDNDNIKELNVPEGAYEFYFNEELSFKFDGRKMIGTDHKPKEIFLIADQVMKLNDCIKEFKQSANKQDCKITPTLSAAQSATIERTKDNFTIEDAKEKEIGIKEQALQSIESKYVAVLANGKVKPITEKHIVIDKKMNPMFAGHLYSNPSLKF